MNMGTLRLWAFAVVSSTSCGAIARSILLHLEPYFNNQAFGTHPGESSYDSLNQSYPASTPYSSSEASYVSSSGSTYHAPGYRGPATPDNIICSGQTIPLGKPTSAFALSVLHSSDLRKKTVLGNITFTYADNTTYVIPVSAHDHWSFDSTRRINAK